MSKRKVIMLTDSSLTYPKVMSPDAQAVLKRLEAYGAETVYVQDQKDCVQGGKDRAGAL